MVTVTPLDKEAILVAHDCLVQIVDIQGHATRTACMKNNSPFRFSFRIEDVGESARTFEFQRWNCNLMIIFLF